jgi:hypothetical protein
MNIFMKIATAGLQSTVSGSMKFISRVGQSIQLSTLQALQSASVLDVEA